MIDPCSSEGNIFIRDPFKDCPFLYVLLKKPISFLFTPRFPGLVREERVNLNT